MVYSGESQPCTGKDWHNNGLCADIQEGWTLAQINDNGAAEKFSGCGLCGLVVAELYINSSNCTKSTKMSGAVIVMPESNLTQFQRICKGCAKSLTLSYVNLDVPSLLPDWMLRLLLSPLIGAVGSSSSALFPPDLQLTSFEQLILPHTARLVAAAPLVFAPTLCKHFAKIMKALVQT